MKARRVLAEKIERNVAMAIESCDFLALAIEISWHSKDHIDIHLVAGNWP
jgi:hypothetical protein